MWAIADIFVFFDVWSSLDFEQGVGAKRLTKAAGSRTAAQLMCGSMSRQMSPWPENGRLMDTVLIEWLWLSRK